MIKSSYQLYKRYFTILILQMRELLREVKYLFKVIQISK